MLRTILNTVFGELYDAQPSGNDPAGFAAFFTSLLAMMCVAPVYLSLIAVPQLFWSTCFVLPKWLTIAPAVLATLAFGLYLRRKKSTILSGARLSLATFWKQRAFFISCLLVPFILFWITSLIAPYSCTHSG